MEKMQTHTKTQVSVFLHFLKRISIKNAMAFLFLFSVVGCISFSSCSDDEDKGGTYDPEKPIKLTDFTPDSAGIAKMMLIDGENFGTDTSLIKVFFNRSQAVVLSSTGSRILTLVPRLPGDTCVISVQVGEQRKEFEKNFYYKIAASVTTIAGNGNSTLKTDEGLDKSQLNPVYIGIDKDNNIFVTDASDKLLKLNEQENSIQILATSAQGFAHRATPITHPETQVLMMGCEGTGARDQFIFCDPKAGWVPKKMRIKEWDLNGFTQPGANETHYFCVYCEVDGNYYTRYNSGQLVRIDPVTWSAKIIGLIPSGTAYGGAIHTINKSQLWLAYDTNASDYNHSICTVDVIDETMDLDGKFLQSFKKLSGATNGDHRDGPLELAQFFKPRQINIDADGNLYVGEDGNHDVRMINTNTMMVETIIGIPQSGGFKDGDREEAKFRNPHGIVTDAEGIIYLSDWGNKRVRRIAIE